MILIQSELRSRIEELRDGLPRRLNDTKKRDPNIENDPFVNRTVKRFLSEFELLRKDILLYLEREAFYDKPVYERVRRIQPVYWTGPAEGLDRQIIVQHFHKCLDVLEEALEQTRFKAPRRTHGTRRKTRRATSPKSPRRRENDAVQSHILSLEELRTRRSLRQGHAAQQLGYSSARMVRMLARDGKLTKSKAGRILVDEKFEQAYKDRHHPKAK